VKTRVTPDEILADHSPSIVDIANRLRSFIKTVMPEARELAYPGWHAIGYRHPKAGYVCGIFPMGNLVRLVFEWGVLLRDETGLLRPGGRQVKFVEFSDPTRGYRKMHWSGCCSKR